jgi:hypothetical protein
MNRWIIPVFALFIVHQSAESQPTYKKMFGTFGGDNFELKELNSTGKFIFSSHNNIDTDHAILKIDEFGEPFNESYIYQAGGSAWGSHKVHFQGLNQFDLIGLHNRPGSYPTVAFILNLDSSLQNQLDSRFYSYRPTGYGIDSWMCFDSTYIIGGSHSDGFQYLPIFYKLDSGLHVTWNRCYLDRSGHIKKIAQASDHGYYLLLQLLNEGMALAKTDTLGNILWCKNYGNPFRDAQGMKLLDDGTLLLLGHMNPALLPNNYTAVNPFIIKTNSSGDILWSRSYGDINNAFIISALDPDVYMDTASAGRIILTGSIVPQWHTFADALLMVMDSSGIPVWSRRYGNDFFDELGTICHQTSDGGFIIGSYNNYTPPPFPPPPNNFANVTVIKTDSTGISNGCMEYPLSIFTQSDTPSVSSLNWILYVDTLVTEIPSNMVDTTGIPTRNENMCTYVGLHENLEKRNDVLLFPNPSSNIINIHSTDFINQIEIYDMLGKRIKKIESIIQKEIQIDLNSCLSGNYLVQVITEKGSKVIKLVLN